MSIRELFRQKLENAEIIPATSVSSKLMRKLARKEFLHFNPTRFNIYYLGGILIAGITASLILFSGSNKSDNSSTLPVPDIINKIDSITYLNVLVEPALSQKSNKVNKNTSAAVENEPIFIPKVKFVKEDVKNSKYRENNIVNRTIVNDSFVKRGLFNDILPGKSKLQTGISNDEPLFETNATEGCPPLKLRFCIKSISCDSCRWTFGDGGYSNEKSPEWIFDIEGEYKVVLNVFELDSLKATSSMIITVYSKPLARFEITPEKAVLPDDEIRFLNYSADAVKYHWDFGDGSSSELFEPLHKYTKFDNYNVRLVVSSDYGCSDSLIVINAFSGSEYFIDFPNAFIPNTQGTTGGFYSTKSDESAHVFHPVFSGITEYQLKIFSKLGILIFESSEINIGWDGYFQGQLCAPGVYIWKVRGNFRNGEPFIKMGDVTLLRNEH